MKALKFATIVIVALMITPAAWAQTATDLVRDLVLSEVEKRVIGEHFGVNVKDMVKDTSMPTWAVKSDDDDDLNDDGDRGKGKKNKGQGKAKNKGKGKSKGLPSGLAKRDSLPPGLQKQLEKNGRLPKGLAKRDLPDDLSAKLPQRSNDQEVSVVEDDVVLIDKATGVILDVLKDVMRTKSATVVNPDGTLKSPGPQSTGLNSILKNIFGGN
ncbi:MAG: hypothetical protein JKY27_00995 [Magnetovibrio sp.]|nr:hypothetical protein [Magnetovibrio sp.]